MTKMKDKLSRYAGRGEGSLLEMLKYNWYLGLTCFGGPSVHVQVGGEMGCCWCCWCCCCCSQHVLSEAYGQ